MSSYQIQLAAILFIRNNKKDGICNNIRGDIEMRDKILLVVAILLGCLLILNIANALEHNNQVIDTLVVPDSSIVL